MNRRILASVESLESRCLLAADPSLVAWYKFDESGGTIAADASGAGNDGELVSGPEWSAGRIGGALTFDRSDHTRVVVADDPSLDITGPLTIAAWVKPETRTTQYIVKKAQSDHVDGYELALSANGRLFFRLNDYTRGDQFRVDSDTRYPTNGDTWMHVVGTFDGSTIRIYVNGELEGQESANTTIATNNLPLGVGGQYDGYRPVEGAVDDVRIYRRALSDAEVAALFAGDTPAPVNAAPLVDAGSDQTAALADGSVDLAGSVSDDGLPGGALTSTWTVQDKPAGAEVVFADAGSPVTTASFSAAGQYVLRLTASDSELSASDQLTVFLTGGDDEPPTDPAPDGLVAWYQLDEAGGGIAGDASPFNNTGVLVNDPSWTGGKFGSALAFSASDRSRVRVADDASLDISGPLSIAAWVKPTARTTQYIVKKARSDNVDGYELGLSASGRLFFRLNDYTQGDRYRVDSTSTYPTNGNTWMHVAGTFDGSSIRIYVNGVLQGTKSAPISIVTNDVPLGVGGQDDGYRPVRGAVDDVRIYNRAVTQNEVTALVQGTPPGNTAPVVNAGSDKAITLPDDSVSLGGSVSDDGLPAPVTAAWSVVDGPAGATVSFADVNAPATTASFSQAGQYTLRLTASDTQLSASDDVTVTVSPVLPPQQAYADALSFAESQLNTTLSQLRYDTRRFVDRTVGDGDWQVVGASNWTSGFLPGTMWQLFKATGDSVWRDRAAAWTTRLASQATQQTEDLHFRLMTSYLHLYETTGNNTYRQVLLDAAASRNTQWNETVGAFETDWRDSHSGDPRANFAVLVDQTSDAYLMLWAGQQTGNQQYIDRAIRHTRTVMNNLVRSDGSTYQFMYFNTADGQAISGETSQGYADESAWSRGQAWAVYFFTAIARETGLADIAAKARQVADYFIAHSPADAVPYWDFEHPSIPNTYRDSSAAAIAASGLLDLSSLLTDPADKAKYKAHAEKVLDSLSSPAYLAQGTSSNGILLHGAQNVPNVPASADVSLIFGDYYFMEAINRYRALS